MDFKFKVKTDKIIKYLKRGESCKVFFCNNGS